MAIFLKFCKVAKNGHLLACNKKDETNNKSKSYEVLVISDFVYAY